MEALAVLARWVPRGSDSSSDGDDVQCLESESVGRESHAVV